MSIADQTQGHLRQQVQSDSPNSFTAAIEPKSEPPWLTYSTGILNDIEHNFAHFQISNPISSQHLSGTKTDATSKTQAFNILTSTQVQVQRRLIEYLDKQIITVKTNAANAIHPKSTLIHDP